MSTEQLGHDDLPVAHPAFSAHFVDPLYDDTSEEFAPFGSDEGSDLVHDWDARRGELDETSSVDTILDGGLEDWLVDLIQPLDPTSSEAPDGMVDAATIIVGAGFTLLRICGRIDSMGKAATLQALGALSACYDAPAEVEQMRADLLAWKG